MADEQLIVVLHQVSDSPLSVLILYGKSGRARKDFDFQVSALVALQVIVLKRLLTLLTCFTGLRFTTVRP